MLLMACGSNNNQPGFEEDYGAKELLQGIWIDQESEMLFMRVTGDSIFYADAQNLPVSFKIVNDSIYLYGNQVTAYKIDRQREYTFEFHSLTGDVIKLYKSEEEEDELAFTENRQVEMLPTIGEVIEKDSVVFYKGIRYRGYVYINPSQMKVFRTSYAENGILVEQVFYDNVIYICVFTGAEKLYGRDITKKMFAELYAPELLEQMILADMDFVGVDEKGYHYQATLRIPESSVYNLVDLVADFDDRLEILNPEK